MSQFLKLLLPAILVLSLIVACQKQDAINQPTAPKTNLAAMARTDNKNYKIHGDTAAAWAARFKQLNNTKMGNTMPAVITLPNNGILQLQAEAAAHGVQLSSIAIHFGIKQDGTIGAFYTPISINGVEIESYNRDNNSDLPTYDGTEACGGGGCATMGILNSPR